MKFQPLDRSYIQCFQCATFVVSAKLYMKSKPFGFFWGVALVFSFLKRRNSQINILSEMYFAPAGIVQGKSVSMSIHEKRVLQTVTNVCKTKRAVTFWNFLFQTSNQQSCCLVAVRHFASPESCVGTTTMKNNLLFGRTFSANRN